MNTKSEYPPTEKCIVLINALVSHPNTGLAVDDISKIIDCSNRQSLRLMKLFDSMKHEIPSFKIEFEIGRRGKGKSRLKLKLK